MSKPLVDSHCHLDRLELDGIEGGLDTLLENARNAGVSHFLCVCINMENFGAVRDLAHHYPNVFATVGVHPNDREDEEPSIERLQALAADPRILAIGETGLDYFRSEGDLEWQRERFRRHIAAARGIGKPLVIHSREAREDTLRLMEEERAAEAGGIMHCFVEDWATAERAMEMGFYISFSGIVTFRNAEALREVARRVPAERLLVETDAPYLAPVPHRGKPNQPAFVRHVAETVAEVRGTTLDEIAEITTANFFRLFPQAAG